jgi:hypothetical protein
MILNSIISMNEISQRIKKIQVQSEKLENFPHIFLSENMTFFRGSIINILVTEVA